jgi:hypothetical protein
VHEKSILLVLAPAAPLVLLDPIFFGWIQLLGSFTMFPLLIKDNLRIPYFTLGAAYCCVLGFLSPKLQSSVKDLGRVFSKEGKFVSLDIIASDRVKIFLISLSTAGIFCFVFIAGQVAYLF